MLLFGRQAVPKCDLLGAAQRGKSRVEMELWNIPTLRQQGGKQPRKVKYATLAQDKLF